MKKFQQKQPGIISVNDLKTVKGKTVYWTIIAILTVMCITALLPTVWVLMIGFKDTQEIYSSASFFPKNVTFDGVVNKFAEAMKFMNFAKTSLNTLFMSVGSVISTLIVCGFGGYVLSRLKPRGARGVFMLIVWTMMMPGQIRTVPLFISFLDFPFVAKLPGEISLINTYWPLWLGAAANCFNVILFKNHFDSISNSLIEAARIDGCGNGRIFFRIMMPLSTPIILYVVIVTMRAAWSDFFMAYLTIDNKELLTLPVKVYTLQGSPSVKMDTYMLCLILSCIPMFILFTIFNKHIVQGANIGGVKG